MFKLMIVDDDKVIRQNLISLVNWEAHGFEKPTEAFQGKDALEKLRKNPVDLVITDMMMPVMDGIALITQGLREFPDTIFVALSNYDDFAYVKNALVIGAIDYLLKFEVTGENLIDLLVRVTEEIRGRQKTREQRIHESIRRKEYALERVVRTAISPTEFSSQPPPEFLSPLHGLFVGIRCPETDDTSLYKAMRQLTRQLHLPEESLCFSAGKTEQLLFLNYPQTVSSRSAVMELMQQLNWNPELWPKSRYILAAETQFISKSDFFIQLFHCRRMLDTAFYEPGIRLVTTRNFLPFSTPTSMEDFYSALSNGIKLLRRKSKEESIRQLAFVFSHIEKERMEPDIVRQALEYLLHEINDMCISCGMYLPEEFSNNLLPSGYFSQFWSLREIHAELERILRAIEYSGGQQDAQISNEIVVKAIRFMKQHFSEPIGLQEVADSVGVSKNYLSRLFRQHADDGFNHILNRIRISQAKRLLKHTDLGLHEISYKCGFSDYRYFKKLFMEQTGVFPAEYRIQHQ